MDYEEYMRSVLGYNQMPNNIYTNTYDDYYYDTQYLNNNRQNVNEEFLNTMYPDIYRIVYPMVCKVCTQYGQREITRELIDSMTDEVYSNVEPDDRVTTTTTTRATVLKNGDVRNPNAKEPEVRSETRQSNFLLRDLIRILILRELGRRPNRPGPGPGPMPPRPPRPPQPPYNMRSAWRPY